MSKTVLRALARLFGVMVLACVLARPAAAQLLAPQSLQVGCDWILAFDPAVPGLGNYAYPETNARYWIAVVSDTAPAGSRLRIEGRYPDARYSAFHVHDGNLFVFEAIADHELGPQPGSANRNLDRTRRNTTITPGGAYTAYVRINTAPPTMREPNTLYRPKPGAFDTQQKKRTTVAYRTYLAEGENTGGVGLPTLVLETPQGDRPLPHAADQPTCNGFRQQFMREGVPVPVSLIPPLVPALMPVFQKFDGAFLNATGLGVGFNPHNGFMTAKTDRDYADFLLVRALLPTYTTRPLAPPAPDVRYWSICQYGAGSTKVYGCLADEDLALDTRGYVHVAISKDAARPAFLPTAYGWLNFGPEKQGAVSIRELLAHPDFARSIEKSSTQNTAADRGAYMPLATYCSRAVLSSAIASGASEESVFSICTASRPLPPLPSLLAPR